MEQIQTDPDVICGGSLEISCVPLSGFQQLMLEEDGKRQDFLLHGRHQAWA